MLRPGKVGAHLGGQSFSLHGGEFFSFETHDQNRLAHGNAPTTAAATEAFGVRPVASRSSLRPRPAVGWRSMDPAPDDEIRTQGRAKLRVAWATCVHEAGHAIVAVSLGYHLGFSDVSEALALVGAPGRDPSSFP